MTTRRPAADRLEITVPADERWWGGAVADGQAMPFGSTPHTRNLATSAGFLDRGADTAGCNQSAPVLLSTHGRFVWSDRPFTFSFTAGRLVVEGHPDAEVVVDTAGSSLRDAFRAASAAHFPAAGRTPAEALFSGPQYNTWIEMPYRPTQQKVLDYVRDLLDAGFPPGVVMIDDQWSPSYGDWTFDPARFPDPAEMVDQLHAWGCGVMLWLVPFVSPDSADFRELDAAGLLLRDRTGAPALRQWWNGWSAVLDATNPGAVSRLRRRLDALVTHYGVDGFKFDAGDLYDYRPDDLTHTPTDPAGHCQAWATIGLEYPYNEFRACWRMGGQPLAQRLHDKPPTWGAGGLGSLIPESIAQGLIGHPFVCPDMIGGGDLAEFAPGFALDQELFVRFAQVAALFPMMQFSMSPHRVLDEQHLAAVREAVQLHQDLVPEILDLARAAARTGEPILRPLEYHHPGYGDVSDEFMIGEDILAAPVLQPGAGSRRVTFPPGTWVSDTGENVVGPAVVDVPVSLRSVPWFRRAR